jgi:hypothetical protein
MESYWFNMTTLNITAASCVVMLIGVMGLSMLAFLFSLMRGKGFGNSMGIASSVVFIPMLMPAFAAALLVSSSYVTIKFMGESAQAQGEVVGHQENHSSDSGTTFSSIVTYTTSDGQTITFEDDSATCDPPCHRIGQRVTVRYVPTNPDQAIIDSPIGRYAWVGVSAILTVVFFIVALFWGGSTYRSKNWGEPAGNVIDAVTGF